MPTSSTRRPVIAWLAACLLAAPAVPAVAQTRVVASVEGFSAPVAPAAAAGAGAMGPVSFLSPASLSAPALNAAPSAPSAGVSRQAVPAAAAAAPAFAAASVPSHSAPRAASAPAGRAAAPFAAETHAAAHLSADSPFAFHAAASAPISDVRSGSAREAAAIATVEGGVAGWTARSAQSLAAAPVLAAASEGTGPLERPSARSSSERPAPGAPAPAPSKLKAALKWGWPILALTAAVTSLDAGTKLFATKYLFTVFHECAWRTPILMAIIPYIIFTAYKARSAMPNDHKIWHWSGKKLGNGRAGFFQDEVSGTVSMLKDHPSLRWATRLYDVSIALMVGGMLGNGIDALRLGGALDWIPLGRSLMNFADVALLAGLAFFQIGTSFFIKAGMAHKAGKPLYFSTVSFLGLPLLGVFIAWAFGSAEGAGVALDLAMKNIGFLYLMGFSMLVGTSRFLAATVLNPFVKRFVAEEGAKASGPA